MIRLHRLVSGSLLRPLTDCPISLRLCVRCQSNERKEGKFRYYDEKNAKTDDDLDLPLRYTTSKAHLGITKTSNYDPPSIQPFAVSMSMLIFMVYFFVLREENDWDDRVYGDGQSLYNKVPGLERKDLLTTLKYQQERGIDTTAVQKRLAELDRMESTH